MTTGLLGCNIFDFNPFGWGGSGSSTSGTRDSEGLWPLALGGVAPGWDLYSVEDSFTDLYFESYDPTLLAFDVPDGSGSIPEAGAALLVPLEVGIAGAATFVDGALYDEFQTITPPQQLIQILIGEARGPLARDATLDDEEEVLPNSISLTAEAVAAVIRNRVEIIRDSQAPSLFAVDGTAFDFDPPSSEYGAVIEATNQGIYQFSPVDPSDPNHALYLNSSERTSLVADLALRQAYDQAVTSAAYIFQDDTEDPTGGAFGFYSPSSAQYDLLETALLNRATSLPSGTGTSDAQFPAMAPIQILILLDVATQNPSSDVPAFVFIRSRDPTDQAVVAQ